jgi:tetratricopeptide (TPR) repeat protein
MEEVGWTHYHARRFDEAIRWSARALDLDPRFEFASVMIAQAHTAQKAYPQALAALDRAKALADWYGVLSERACNEALMHRETRARQILATLLARRASAYVDPYAIAVVYVALGERDRAFEWLARAVEEHSPYVVFLHRESKLDPLREDARFAALAARVGLAP